MSLNTAGLKTNHTARTNVTRFSLSILSLLCFFINVLLFHIHSSEFPRSSEISFTNIYILIALQNVLIRARYTSSYNYCSICIRTSIRLITNSLIDSIYSQSNWILYPGQQNIKLHHFGFNIFILILFFNFLKFVPYKIMHPGAGIFYLPPLHPCDGSIHSRYS